MQGDWKREKLKDDLLARNNYTNSLLARNNYTNSLCCKCLLLTLIFSICVASSNRTVIRVSKFLGELFSAKTSNETSNLTSVRNVHLCDIPIIVLRCHYRRVLVWAEVLSALPIKEEIHQKWTINSSERLNCCGNSNPAMFTRSRLRKWKIAAFEKWRVRTFMLEYQQSYYLCHYNLTLWK